MFSESEQAAIERSLEKILADEKFLSSPQMSAFLRYVVEETLKGKADRIKAYTVAIDALGKSESFDPQNDPSVRVMAKRLRTSLNQYYERTAGHEKIIHMKAGSYKPIFTDPLDMYELIPDMKAKVDGPVVAEERALQSDKGLLGRCHAQARDDESDSQEINHEMPVAKHEAQVENDAKAQISNIVSLKSSIFNTAEINKYLPLAFILSVFAALMVGGSDSSEATEMSILQASTDQQALTMSFATTESTKPYRTRPVSPTMMIRAERRDDNISRSLVSSISHAISKFDHVQLLKSTSVYEQAKKFPEDYEITVDTLLMSDSKKVTVNLVNSLSGRIAYSDDLIINGDVSKHFSKADIEAVEIFVARIVQKSGPLIFDYRTNTNISDGRACLYGLSQPSDMNKDNEECINRLLTNTNYMEAKHALRAELSLLEHDRVKPSKRKTTLLAAKTAAQKNLELMPHSADSHALMMRVLQANGEYNTALKHGEFSMDINHLDGHNMLAFATLLEDMAKVKQAGEMRRKARSLSIAFSGLSL